jgi:hypothetical protein
MPSLALKAVRLLIVDIPLDLGQLFVVNLHRIS